MFRVLLFSDGSARGNPDGPGGYGTILQFTDAGGNLHEKELSRGYRRTTNNRMELLGCIAGLEALNRPCIVDVYSDSKYLTDAFNQHWIESWEAEVTFHWVKGHAGHPENERCDRLATGAADGDSLSEDIQEDILP